MHPRLHGPTDHPARIEINHHGQIQKAFMGLDIGNVGDPGLIRCCRVEVLFELVGRYDGRLAAIVARATVITKSGP